MKRSHFWDYPGGPVVKTPPSNAGGVGSIPGQGTKVPHAAGCGQKSLKKKKKNLISKRHTNVESVKKKRQV